MLKNFHPFGLINGDKINIKHYPKILEIDLTNQCNQNCKWCRDKGYRGELPASLPLDLITKLLDDVSGKVKTIIFTGGGEPTLSPVFEKIILYAKEKGFNVGLITNGEKVTNYIEAIKHCCDLIQISLDAGTFVTYNKLHQGSKFAHMAVINGLRALCKDKKNTVGVSFLVTAGNFFELPKVLETCSIIGVDYLAVTPVYVKGFSLSPRIKDSVYSFIKNFDNPSDMRVISSLSYLESQCGGSCVANGLITTVGADGKVYLCPALRGKSAMILGDLKENRFKKIWSGKRRQLILEKLDTSRCPALCKYKKYNEAHGLLAGEMKGELI